MPRCSSCHDKVPIQRQHTSSYPWASKLCWCCWPWFSGLWDIPPHTRSVCIFCVKKMPHHLMEENHQLVPLDKCQCIIYELCRAASGESTCWCQICPLSKPFWVQDVFWNHPEVPGFDTYFLFLNFELSLIVVFVSVLFPWCKKFSLFDSRA